MSLHLFFALLAFWAFTPFSAPAAKLEPTLADRERMAKESKQALGYLEDFHYNRLPLKKIEPRELLRDYIGELDYNRMVFNETEIADYIKRFDATLQSVYLSRGDLYPAIEIYNDYYKKAKERMKWIQKRLKGKFDFTTRDTYTPDRSKAMWPASNKEADSLWEDRLRGELLLEMLNNASLEDARAKLQKRYDRNEKILEEFDLRDLQQTFLTSIGGQYDPHSTYFSNDGLEDFTIQMSNTLVGIGALLRDEDGYCVVQELIPGGPAESGGALHTGDKIIEVAQEGKEPVDVVEMKISKIVQMIRGESGSTVILTVIPADAADPSVRKKVSIVREEVKLTENLANAQVVEVPSSDGNSTLAIGIIELPSFYGSGDKNSPTPTGDIEELIEKLHAMGIKGLVLDLRRNGGGLLSEAIQVGGLFVPKAPIVQVRDGNGRIRIDWDRNSRVAYDGPLVVLTSRMSASASEIVAGALQSLDRAVIVGDSATHGKGTVQAIFEVDKGMLSQFVKRPPSGGIKVTIQKFYLPSGESTQNKGVDSDIALPSVNDVLPIGESDLPNALPWDSISPALNSVKKGMEIAYLDTPTKDFLLTRSRERQSTMPEFAYLNRLVERLKLRQQEKTLSLNYDARLKEKQLDEAFKLQIERERKQLSSDRYASAEVLLDLSWQMKAEHQEKLKQTPLPNGQPRANAIYENIFYYAPEGSQQIREVRADNIDFEALGAYKKALAEKVSLTESQLTAVLDRFRQADNRSEFNINAIFEKTLGQELAPEVLANLPRAFFEAAIALNPDIALEKPSLDIPLREALRVAADWAEARQSNLFKAADEPAGAAQTAQLSN